MTRLVQTADLRLGTLCLRWCNTRYEIKK